MESPLRSFCLACARYADGDIVGQTLAVIAAAPYFAVYHVAVVLHSRRELHMAFVMLGLLLSSVLSTAVKKLVKQPRPAAMCALLGNCHKHGMPSSHSCVMAFAATTCLLLYMHRRRQLDHGPAPKASPSQAAAASGRARLAAAGSGPGMSGGLARAVELLEVQALAALALAVGYGRVYLGYHSPGQVAAGLALGACCAVLWWRLTLAACQRWAGPLLRLAPLRGLHMRNTLGWADVHAAEAALYATPAASLHVD